MRMVEAHCTKGRRLSSCPLQVRVLPLLLAPFPLPINKEAFGVSFAHQPSSSPAEDHRFHVIAAEQKAVHPTHASLTAQAFCHTRASSLAGLGNRNAYGVDLMGFW